MTGQWNWLKLWNWWNSETGQMTGVKLTEIGIQQHQFTAYVVLRMS